MERLSLKQVDPMWFRLASYISIMFFVFVSDGMLSDFVPGFLEQKLGSTFAMGLVMSTSSMAGIILDMSFAQLFRGFSVKKMMLTAITGGAVFVGCLYGVVFLPWVLVMVASMVAWGFYYEFLVLPHNSM
jgi:hypothetical protein